MKDVLSSLESVCSVTVEIMRGVNSPNSVEYSSDLSSTSWYERKEVDWRNAWSFKLDFIGEKLYCKVGGGGGGSGGGGSGRGKRCEAVDEIPVVDKRDENEVDCEVRFNFFFKSFATGKNINWK